MVVILRSIRTRVGPIPSLNHGTVRAVQETVVYHSRKVRYFLAAKQKKKLLILIVIAETAKSTKKLTNHEGAAVGGGREGQRLPAR